MARHSEIEDPRQRGSSLVELVIALAAIGILASVVFVGRGFLEDFKEDKTVTTIVSIQKAAPLWAERTNNGLGYGGGLAPNNTSISLSAMCDPNSATPPVLNVGKTNGRWNCGRLKTAWDEPIGVAPYPNPPPAAYPATKIQITACFKEKIRAEDVAAKLLNTQSFDSAVQGNGLGCVFNVVAVSNK